MSAWSWALPAFLTFWVWAYISVKPLPASRGDFDFSSPFVAMCRVAGAIVTTLVVWLIYFIVRFALG